MPAGKGIECKAAVELKAALEELGGLTVENVKKLPHALRKKGFAALKAANSKLDEELKAEADDASDDLARRRVLLHFIIKSTDAVKTGTNIKEVRLLKAERKRVVWLTQNQLAGPMFLNSHDDAATAITSVKSNPHTTNKALRDKKVLEYEWYVEWTDKSLEELEAAGIRTEVAMDAESAAAVEAEIHLPSSSSSVAQALEMESDEKRPANKQKTEKDKAPTEKGESEELKQAKKDYDESVVGLKTVHSRMMKELSEVDVVKQRLKRRTQWGEGPLQFLEAEATRWTQEAGKLLMKWTEEKLWIEDHGNDMEQMKTRAGELTKQAKTIADTYKKEFVRDVLGEFSSLKKAALAPIGASE